MALLADVRARILEPLTLDVMAVAALRLPLTHVKLVPRTDAVLCPRLGNHLRRHAVRHARPEGHKARDAGSQNHHRGEEAQDSSPDAPGHRPTP
jgi:hypothetical protein